MTEIYSDIGLYKIKLAFIPIPPTLPSIIHQKVCWEQCQSWKLNTYSDQRGPNFSKMVPKSPFRVSVNICFITSLNSAQSLKSWKIFYNWWKELLKMSKIRFCNALWGENFQNEKCKEFYETHCKLESLFYPQLFWSKICF